MPNNPITKTTKSAIVCNVVRSRVPLWYVGNEVNILKVQIVLKDEKYKIIGIKLEFWVSCSVSRRVVKLKAKKSRQNVNMNFKSVS